MRCSTLAGNVFSRSKTLAYSSSLHTCSSFRSALVCAKLKRYYTKLKSMHLQSSMRTQTVGPMGVRNECDGKGTYDPWPPMMTDLKT